MIESKVEIKLQFPYEHSMSIAQQLIPIYKTTMYKNKTIALNVAKLLMLVIKMPQGQKVSQERWQQTIDINIQQTHLHGVSLHFQLSYKWKNRLRSYRYTLTFLES